MRSDYLTYKRAAGTSWQGMVIQALMAAGLLAYAVLARDHAGLTAAIFVALGVVVWLALGVVFDQHRRERIEAMEAEALAATPEARSSVFDAGGQEFRPQARRLAGLYSIFWPIVSVSMGITLVVVGIVRLRQGWDLRDPGAAEFRHPEWTMGVGVAIAAAGFMLARYAAGMAKHAAWGNLRAGASYAMGSSLLGLALAVSHFVDFVGTDLLVRYMQVVAPAFLILVGAETFLNLVLAAYRPRAKAEAPRPAFDSRFLGLVAAPDRIAQSISDAINYQLGFNVTSGWFYQLITRWLGALGLVAVLVIWLLTWVAVIKPDDRAMILRFGEVVREDVGPGLHFKMGWPVDEVVIPELMERDERGRLRLRDRTATGLRVLPLATSPPAIQEPILWTNDHAGEEVFQFVRASRGRGEAGADTAADAGLADLASVSIEIPLHYAVRDVALYDQLAAPEQREDLLRSVARREITLFFQGVVLDDVLGGDRIAKSKDLRARIQAAFDRLNVGPDGEPRGSGVEIVYVGMTGVHPPKETALAFETPVQADQRREANIDAAEAEAIRTLTTAVGNVALARSIVEQIDAYNAMVERGAARAELLAKEEGIARDLERAGGAASRLLADARADRWARHMSARGLAARAQGQLAMYEAAPSVFRARAYFASLREAMTRSRVYITGREGVVWDVNLEDKELGRDIFTPEQQP